MCIDAVLSLVRGQEHESSVGINQPYFRIQDQLSSPVLGGKTAPPCSFFFFFFGVQDQLSSPWRVSDEVLMLMGEEDGSVAPLLEQVDFVRPYVPDGIPFRACHVPSESSWVFRVCVCVLGGRCWC